MPRSLPKTRVFVTFDTPVTAACALVGEHADRPHSGGAKTVSVGFASQRPDAEPPLQESGTEAAVEGWA
jgi:hypothetical protein